MITTDGNNAVASVAYRTNEVIAIYPITPSSTMAEIAGAWSGEGKKNLWGDVPTVMEMQSEAGAISTVHGALQTGALSTSFTSSQGLLLMIPTLYKVAGELTPFVLHVAARTVATHALSIFGDHSDVMAVRQTGCALLSAASVQEAQDFALISQVASLNSRVPFIHFFDGFRTSHEINKIAPLSDDTLQQMLPQAQIDAHRARALSPDHPVIRGTSANPDTYFQSREATNPYYNATCQHVIDAMSAFAALTGREYKPFEFVGDPQAERVIVLMGSGIGTAEEVIETLNARGEKVGVLKVRLYRPFSAEHLRSAGRARDCTDGIWHRHRRRSHRNPERARRKSRRAESASLSSVQRRTSASRAAAECQKHCGARSHQRTRRTGGTAVSRRNDRAG